VNNSRPERPGFPPILSDGITETALERG